MHLKYNLEDSSRDFTRLSIKSLLTFCGKSFQWYRVCSPDLWYMWSFLKSEAVSEASLPCTQDQLHLPVSSPLPGPPPPSDAFLYFPSVLITFSIQGSASIGYCCYQSVLSVSHTIVESRTHPSFGSPFFLTIILFIASTPCIWVFCLHESKCTGARQCPQFQKKALGPLELWLQVVFYLPAWVLCWNHQWS